MKNIFGILLGGATIATLLEVLRELRNFRVRRYAVHMTPENKPKMGIKAVFLSDLHGKCYGRNNDKLVEAVRRESPDYIWVGGDMLTRTEPATMETAVRLIEDLTEVAPVYCANGNHEQLMKEYPERYGNLYAVYKKRLEKAGAYLLENESIKLDVPSSAIRRTIQIEISGLEIPSVCYGKLRQPELTVSQIEKCIGKPDKTRYQILLAHNPVYMEQYIQWGADLVLGGHLHGGIIRIPGIGGLITPQAQLFPKYSGDIYMENQHYSIVSRGLGTHTVNVRLFNMAELVVLTID